MAGFIVVLESKEPGVLNFPTLPDLEQLVRDQLHMFWQDTGQSVVSPPQYLEDDNRVLSYTYDRQRAKIFRTEEAAQAAIDSIPASFRPSGFSIQSID